MSAKVRGEESVFVSTSKSVLYISKIAELASLARVISLSSKFVGSTKLSIINPLFNLSFSIGCA